MVETRAQRIRREAQEAIRSKDIDTYTFDEEEFYNTKTFKNCSTVQDLNDESLTLAELQDYLSSSRFNKLLETILCKNPQCYFLILSQDGVK